MSRRKANPNWVYRTYRLPAALDESIKRNHESLGASSQAEFVMDAIRFYLDNKSQEAGTRSGYAGIVDAKLNKQLEAHLGNTNNEIKGTTWYLTLIFVAIMWFAEQFFKLMRIQMMMINDLRFQTSPKSTDEALQDRTIFEQHIESFTAFKKPDIISQQIAEAPKLYIPIRDKLSTLHKAQTESAEAKADPKPQT